MQTKHITRFTKLDAMWNLGSKGHRLRSWKAPTVHLNILQIPATLAITTLLTINLTIRLITRPIMDRIIHPIMAMKSLT